MGKTVFKVKGFLGFCQCKKCWNRAYATMKIKGINKDIDVCKKHLDKTLENAEFTGFSFTE